MSGPDCVETKQVPKGIKKTFSFFLVEFLIFYCSSELEDPNPTMEPEEF